MADIGQLYEAHYGFIFRFLMSRCHNAALAEELTQETFFRAHINLPQLREEAKAAAWLCRIALNLYFAWCREQKRLVALEDVSELRASEDLAEATEQKLLSAQAMEHLSTLDEPYRSVFRLHALNEVPLKEISALYKKSESWARVTFFRARQMIVERMKL